MNITKTQIRIKLDEARKLARKHIMEQGEFESSHLRCEVHDYTITALESGRFMLNVKVFYYYRKPHTEPTQGFVPSIVYTMPRS